MRHVPSGLLAHRRRRRAARRRGPDPAAIEPMSCARTFASAPSDWRPRFCCRDRCLDRSRNGMAPCAVHCTRCAGVQREHARGPGPTPGSPKCHSTTISPGTVGFYPSRSRVSPSGLGAWARGPSPLQRKPRAAARRGFVAPACLPLDLGLGLEGQCWAIAVAAQAPRWHKSPPTPGRRLVRWLHGACGQSSPPHAPPCRGRPRPDHGHDGRPS